MTNPDVTPVGFAATDHPHAPLVRKRGVWWLLVGGALIAGGIAGVVLYVVQLVGSSSDLVDDAVASGRIAGLSAPATPAATFTVEVAMPYTVWVDTGGIISSGTRDTVVAAANCEATFSDGTTESFRGARQGTSVERGDFATIGTFEAPKGTAEVACRSESFGGRAVRDELEQQRQFFVTLGPPDSEGLLFLTLFAGIPALIFGSMAIGRGWLGSVRRRSS